MIPGFTENICLHHTNLRASYFSVTFVCMFICSLYEEKDDICIPFVNYVLQSIKNIYIKSGHELYRFFLC